MMTLPQEIEFDYITTNATADLFQRSAWRRRYIGAKAWVRRWLEMREVPEPKSDLVKFKIKDFWYAPVSETTIMSQYNQPPVTSTAAVIEDHGMLPE